jgi:hypothetical protein
VQAAALDEAQPPPELPVEGGQHRHCADARVGLRPADAELASLEVDVPPRERARLADPEPGPAEQREHDRLLRVRRRAEQGGVLLRGQPVVRPAPRPRPLDPVDRRAELAPVGVDKAPERVEVVEQLPQGGDPDPEPSCACAGAVGPLV